jgi:hypothetical protein
MFFSSVLEFSISRSVANNPSLHGQARSATEVADWWSGTAAGSFEGRFNSMYRLEAIKYSSCLTIALEASFP